MTKTHTTLTIDVDVMKRAKMLGINVSGAFNDFLEGLVLKENKDIDLLNVELERLKVDKLSKKVLFFQQELTKTEENIAKFEENQLKKEEKDLQNEVKEIEKLKTCVNCGNLIPDLIKKHTFPIGIVCNSCFLADGSDNFKRWNTKKGG